jgi:hypothetical protein
VHAQQRRQAVRDRLGEPAAFARAWDERTESAVATFHRHQVSADRIQWAEMTALRESRRYTSPASELSSLARAAAYDATLFRAFLEILLCLALPRQVLQRPSIAEAIEGLRDRIPPPGPDRRQLLRLLSAERTGPVSRR